MPCVDEDARGWQALKSQEAGEQDKGDRFENHHGEFHRRHRPADARDNQEEPLGDRWIDRGRVSAGNLRVDDVIAQRLQLWI